MSLVFFIYILKVVKFDGLFVILELFGKEL